MRAYIESTFDCPAELAWAEVQTSKLLSFVMRPLIRFTALRGSRMPERWEAGKTVVGRLYVLSVIPIGLRTLHYERIDQQARLIQTRERDPLVRRWDHLISVSEAPGGRTRYSDDIEIDAGLLTPIVWLFAQLFYRHRQRRWRRVARRLTAGAAGEMAPVQG